MGYKAENITEKRKSHAEWDKRSKFYPCNADSLQHFGVWPTVPVPLMCDFWLRTIYSTNVNFKRKGQTV